MRRFDRGGFALLAVLWALALGSAVALATGRVAEHGRLAALNRMALTRAYWAQEACLATLRADYGPGREELRLDTLDLGRGTWCAASDRDPAARVNLNVADSATLVRLFGVRGAAGLLDWRDADDLARSEGAESEWYRADGRRTPRNGPLESDRELLRIRGIDAERYRAVRSLITVRGDGRIDVDRAPSEVLRALSWLDRRAVDRILLLRAAGRDFESLTSLRAALDPSGRGASGLDVAEIADRLTFADGARWVEIVGGVRHSERPIESRMAVALLDQRGELTVLRREVE